MTMRYDVIAHSSGTAGAVVRLHGRIDREAAEALEAAYGSVSGCAALELDFTDVDYINSTGIALIVSLLARARAEATVVRARGLTPHYRHIFDITRLSDFIEIVDPVVPA